MIRWELHWTRPPHPLPWITAECPTCRNRVVIAGAPVEQLLAATFAHCGELAAVPNEIKTQVRNGR